MNGGSVAFLFVLGETIGSLIATYLKFTLALEVWLLALGLVGLALILTSFLPALRGLRLPLAFGSMIAVGGIVSHLVYVA